MVKITLSLFVMSVFLEMVVCQTFQYSRGWTNGKRSDDTALSLTDLKPRDLTRRHFDLSTAEFISGLCCETSCRLKKVVRRVRQIDGKTKVYLVPCEILRNHHTKEEESQELQDILQADGYQRLFDDYDSNNDN